MRREHNQLGATLMIENGSAIETVKKFLEQRIIGRRLEGFSTTFGDLRRPAAKAVAIVPPDATNPGQAAQWITWSVQMQPLAGESGKPWSCYLGRFISASELGDLFRQYFGDAVR